MGERAKLDVLAALLLALSAAPAQAQVQQGGKTELPRSLPEGALSYHVLDRLSFGHDDESLGRLRSIGVRAWIEEQLRPELLAESPVLEARLAALPPAKTSRGDSLWRWEDLHADDLLRKRYSRRQLREVMAEFWSNHFNTSLELGRAGQTGFFSGLVFTPGGKPVVCGYDASNTKPRCGFYTAAGWQKGDADSFSPSGWYLSLRNDPVTGHPAVAHYEFVHGAGTGNLRLSRWDGSAWRSEVVDAAGDVGAWAALAFDGAGRAHIAYQDRSRPGLKLASWTGTGWAIQLVRAGNIGWQAALALDPAGRPLIAHLDVAASAIRLERFDGSQWRTHTVAALALDNFDVELKPWPPRILSLAMDPASDQPTVAYYDTGGRRLRLARFDGSLFRSETVDATGDVGLYPSLAFDPATLTPAIAYFDRSGGHARLARSLDGMWLAETVDASEELTGEWCSLAFDAAGQPAISWYNGSAFRLELARPAGGKWQRETVETLSKLQFLYTGWERVEGERFRALALGRFRDLLEASATSAGMMVYLNNNQNVAGAGNENYARELLELHTVGVDGGYSQEDVEALALAFTGWGSKATSTRCDYLSEEFCYNHLAHDGRPRRIMGMLFADDSAALPANWRRQGEAILDRLSCHPATARFLCGKLIEKFVADDPPPALLAECERSWLVSDGDIGQVLETLLLSAEFVAPEHFLNMVRTPLEYTLAAVRHLEGASDGRSLVATIATQGAEPFRVPPPTGYSERGDWWVNSSTFLARWQFADELAHATEGTTIDPVGLVESSGLDRADAIVEFFAGRLLRGELDPVQRADVLDCLNGGDPGWLDLRSPAVDQQLRDTVAMMLAFPGYHKQ